jgi:hypothetical protein
MAFAWRFSQVNKKHRSSLRKPARKVISALLVTVAAIGVSLFVISGWAKSQLLDTNSWVSFVTPLPKEPAIAEALTHFVTSEVLEIDRVEERVSDALPENAGFLAPTLAAQLQDRARADTRKVVDSSAFEATWISAHQSAHQSLLDQTINGDPELAQLNQRFMINLQPVRPNLTDQLGLAAKALGIAGNSPNQPLQIDVDLGAKPQRISFFIKLVEFFYAVMPSLVIAALIWGVILAANRRLAILGMAVITTVLLLLDLIAIKAYRLSLLDRIGSGVYRNAAAMVYDSLVASLSWSVLLWLAVAILVWVLALFAGPGDYRLRLQRLIRTEELLESNAYKEWRAMRLWLAEQKYYFWTVIIMIALFYLAFVINIDKQVAFNTLFSVLAAVGLIQLMATPPYLINVTYQKPRSRSVKSALR